MHVYAVTAVYIDLGEGFIRRVNEPEVPELGPVFVSAVDLTGRTLSLHGIGPSSPGSSGPEPSSPATPVPCEPIGIETLVLVPVTEDSVNRFEKLVRNPPCELRAVDDWWCYFNVSVKETAGRAMGLERGGDPVDGRLV